MNKDELKKFKGLSKNYSLGRKQLPEVVTKFIHNLLSLEETILDLGCGNGISTRQINTKFIKKIIGVDINPQMINLAQNSNKLDKINYLVGSAENLPINSNSIDKVFCVRSFHWFSNLRAIQEIFRVTKEGGSFIIIDKDEISSHKKGFKEFIYPFLTEKVPDAKKNYESSSDFINDYFDFDFSKKINIKEKYNYEESINYFKSLSWWTFVRDKQSTNMVNLLSEFISNRLDKEGFLTREVMVTIRSFKRK